MKPEKITLYFRQEKSDKVYKAALEEQDGLFIVNFAYGRRGATLKTGTKTQAPVPYEKAKKIYDKLVLSKSAKGYVPNEDESDYVYETDQIKTGIHCQLLNPIEETELADFINNDEWWGQQKMDGKRMLIKKTEELIAINRRGLSVGAPQSIFDSAQKINRKFIIDGEAIGDDLYVFDLLNLDEEDIRNKTYQERFELLSNLGFSDSIKIVEPAKTAQAKKAQVDLLRKESAEGVVYKKHASIYEPGRPNSGGNQRKFKFYETASVIVSNLNDKRSVGVSVIDNGKEVFVGNVTISVNKEIPQERDIIEVRYLYAYKGGSLYQPTFLMVRTDIDEKECLIKQLKYKQEL